MSKSKIEAESAFTADKAREMSHGKSYESFVLLRICEGIRSACTQGRYWYQHPTVGPDFALAGETKKRVALELRARGFIADLHDHAITVCWPEKKENLYAPAR